MYKTTRKIADMKLIFTEKLKQWVVKAFGQMNISCFMHN